MARTDSGLETLFSDESPCELAATPSSGLGSVSSGAEAREAAPPQPPRISAVLAKGKSVIRPIACKPAAMAPSTRFSNTGERYGSTPILTRPGSQLTLYGSNSDLRHHHHHHINNYSLDRKHISSSVSASSSPPLAVASLSSLPLVSSGKMLGYDSLESVRKSPIPNGVRHSSQSSHCSRATSGKGSSYRQAPGSTETGSLLDLTPSPSDSGVTELEAALRERDSELQYLRQTMEHNEQVIFRVYQEKERMWERELRRLESVHEGRLRVGAQKALRLEQMLMMQTYQLQQDKKRLREEADRAVREASELRQEVDLLRGRLEETEWGLCQKSGELSLLKVQIKDSQGEQTTKDHELLQLRGQNRKMKTDLEEQAAEIEALKTLLSEREKEVESTQAEVERLTAELGDACTKTNQCDTDTMENLREELTNLCHERDTEREQFQRERLTWAQEKEKVLRYQRQLQLNYVQMFRRTRALEAEIESLTMELELENKSGCPKKKLPAIEMGHTIEL